MGGVIQGLNTGYNIVRDMQERDRMQEEREHQRKRQGVLDAQNAERHNAQMSNFGLQTQLLQNSVSRLGVINNYEDKKYKLDMDLANLNLDQARKAALQKDADAEYNNLIIASKTPDADQYRVGAMAQDFVSKYGKLASYNFLNDPDSAIGVGDAFMKNGMPSIKHIAATWQGEANKSVGLKGRNGSVITHNEIIGIEPTKDGQKVRIKMITYTKDGQKYESYVNNTRDSSPGTGFLELPWESVFNSVTQKAEAARLFKRLTSYASTKERLNNKPPALNPKDALAAANDIQRNVSDLYESLNSEFGVSDEQKAQVLQQIQGLQAQYDQLVKSAGLTSSSEFSDQQLQEEAVLLANGDQALAAEALNELKVSRANGRNDSLQSIIAMLRKNNQSGQSLGLQEDQAVQIARGLRAPSSLSNDPFLANNRL